MVVISCKNDSMYRFYSGGRRFGMVQGEQSMPTMPIESANVDVDESVGQEPMANDGTTHLSNASTHVLPFSPSVSYTGFQDSISGL